MRYAVCGIAASASSWLSGLALCLSCTAIMATSAMLGSHASTSASADARHQNLDIPKHPSLWAIPRTVKQSFRAPFQNDKELVDVRSSCTCTSNSWGTTPLQRVK